MGCTSEQGCQQPSWWDIPKPPCIFLAVVLGVTRVHPWGEGPLQAGSGGRVLGRQL